MTHNKLFDLIIKQYMVRDHHCHFESWYLLKTTEDGVKALEDLLSQLPEDFEYRRRGFKLYDMIWQQDLKKFADPGTVVVRFRNTKRMKDNVGTNNKP